jgi:hypothetical protein
MFNIGGDDKEKLEENMEEIKQLVSNGQNQENQQEGTGQELDPQMDEEQGISPQPEQNTMMEETEDTEFQAENTGDQEEDVDDMEEELEQLQNQVQQNQSQQDEVPQTEETGGQIQPPKQQEQQEGQGVQDSQQGPEETSDDLEGLKNEIEDQISTIEEGRKNRSIEEDVAEINKEREEEREQGQKEQPLFLEVENFEQIRDMIEEMHYLTTEMDDVMEHLVVGVEEDQETVQEAGQIMQEFQIRRDKIETKLKDN